MVSEPKQEQEQEGKGESSDNKELGSGLEIPKVGGFKSQVGVSERRLEQGFEAEESLADCLADCAGDDANFQPQKDPVKVVRLRSSQ
jgi:hypothetical protein